MRFWIILYTHRHGHDVWPIFQETDPKWGELHDDLEKWGYEPDREDEDVDIIGPFNTP